jgi:hypothetical protein
MKTLLKVGVALLASLGAFALRADNKPPTLYAVTILGPGNAYKASNPDTSGEFLVVGGTPDPNVIVRPTVWTVSTDGTVMDVFIYDNLGTGQALDVNDHGMVIGSSNSGDFVDIPGVGIRFLQGTVQAVNNQGVVVGFTGDPSGPDKVSGAVWYVDPKGGITGPVLTRIGPGVTFMPNDINDEGTMCGFILSGGGSNVSAAIAEFDRNGELEVTDLGVLHPGDTGSSARSINNNGFVAGFSGFSAFVWDPSQPNKLTSLGQGVAAPDVNDNSQVAFSTVNKANVTIGAIWQNGKTTDLNTVLAAPINDVLELAFGINNAGHIVGVTQLDHAFILTPR